MITKGFERWFSIPGALPDHVAPISQADYWYISAEKFYQEARTEVPLLFDRIAQLERELAAARKVALCADAYQGISQPINDTGWLHYHQLTAALDALAANREAVQQGETK